MPALGGVVGKVLLTARGGRVGWEEKAGCSAGLPAAPVGAEPSVLGRVHHGLTHQPGECSGSLLARSPTHRLHRPPKRPSPLASCHGPTGRAGGDRCGWKSRHKRLCQSPVNLRVALHDAC